MLTLITVLGIISFIFIIVLSWGNGKKGKGIAVFWIVTVALIVFRLYDVGYTIDGNCHLKAPDTHEVTNE